MSAYTEEEAKTKWCPFAMTFGRLSAPIAGSAHTEDHYGPQNRGAAMGLPLSACKCIGSACMAWQQLPELWIDPENPEQRYAAKHKTTMQMETPRGYCGLAGAQS